jgi:hypothetical protein
MKHLVEAMNNAVGEENWYAALTLALTLPDICSKLESPEIEFSRQRYVKWYDANLQSSYEKKIGYPPEMVCFPSGDDLYALRCAFLHQGEFTTDGQKAQDVLTRFNFIASRNTNYRHRNLFNGTTLQLDVGLFCTDMGNAVNQWLDAQPAGSEIRKRISKLGIIQT